MRPHLHRVRQFHLVTDFFYSPPTVSSQFQPFDMPRLECFLYTPLDIAEFDNPPATSPLLPFTGGALLLKSIRLNGPMLGLIRPPFSGISQLCLREERFPIPFRSICEILKSCAALVKFSFSGHTQRPHRRLATMHDIFPFTLPELRYLMLSNGGNSDVILAAMTAPKLSVLRLNNFDEGDLAYFLQLPESSSSKFPVLESLSFFDNTFPIDVYHDIARVLPAIRSFSCLNSSYTDEVLEFLVPLPTSSSVTHMPWPNLVSFSFSQAQFHEKPQAMLCSLVSARIALRSPILNLFLGHTNRLLLDPERLDWLRERLRVDENREMPEDEEMRLLAEFSSDYDR
ncbi:F-box domain-containing protein [Mycena venus]|uniref:F-box domain-containing protein n=1 Tax=Mycena venus TaxID=2733690 RepID=A0A8H6XAH6_9AGAR|nr:F-box domain-containing protein [Mycena venus]